MPRTTFTGDRFVLNCGSVAVVSEYRSFDDIDVITNNGYEATAQLTQLKNGSVKDPYARTVFGIGFLGRRYKNREYADDQFKCWNRMFMRCYSSAYHEKQPTYEDCSVSIHWHDFSNFCDWHEESYIEGYVLDKDLKRFGNKVYNKDACAFIPAEINGTFLKPSKKVSGFPHGVIMQPRSTTVYRSSIGTKSFPTMEEARDHYWLQKRKKADELCEKWPQFADLINNYLPQFKAANWDAK